MRCTFRCPGCGYKANVSGGDDGGEVRSTTTIVCRDCRKLDDVITGYNDNGTFFACCETCRRVAWSLQLSMRSPLLSVFVGLFACLLSSGCATVIKGSNQTIPISSDPSGAAVFADGNRVGSTPTSIELTRKHSHVITLEMRGYESENITLKPSIGGAVAGNILAGGLIGWGVDATTGAQYNLHPQEVNVRLRQKTAETTTAPQKSVSGLLAELEKLDVMKAGGKISPEEYARLRESVLQQYSSK